MRGSTFLAVLLTLLAAALLSSASADPYRVSIVDESQSPSVVVAPGESVEMKVIIWNVTLPTVAGASMYLSYDPAVISEVSCEGSVFQLVNSCREKAPGRYLVEAFDTILDNQGYTGDVMVALLRITTNASAPVGSTTDLVLSAAPLGEALGSPVWGPGWAEIEVTFEGGNLLLESCIPGISVNKTADPTSAEPLSNVNFTITVENTGNCTLDPVTVTDTLPQGMSYVSDDSGGVVEDGTVTWILDPLSSEGSTATIHLVAQIDEEAAGTLENLVTAEGKPGNMDNVTDSDTADVEVLAKEPGIDVEKESDVEKALPCNTVTFAINVVNSGDFPLDPVYVVDVLPRGMIYVSSSPEGNVYKNAVGWDLGTLEVGETRQLQLVAKVHPKARGTLENNVTAIGVSDGAFVSDYDLRAVKVIPCPKPRSSAFEPCKENLDGVKTGDQMAVSFGLPNFPWKVGTASNRFDLSKDQDVCCNSLASVHNGEMVGGGDQASLAGGLADAKNGVSIATAQG